jgi:membrane fusion protein (multidrug efflux system)
MKNITIIFSTLFFASLLAACGGSVSSEAKKAQLEKLKTQQAEITAQIATLQEEILAMGDSLNKEEDRSKVIALTAVVKQNFIHAIDVQGRVDGDENITYSAKVPSSVTKIKVKVGQLISKGQILAELDTKATRAQLETTKKQYELANTMFEKRKELWEQKVGSEIEYLQAKNAKESLEKIMDAQKEALDMYYIKADYNGTVDEVSIKVGQNVAPGVPCITVINPDALKVKADLSEAYASIVKIGDAVSITFPDIQKTISAKVSYSSKTIDKMSRTFNVEINLPSDNDLSPNMVSQIKIVDYNKANAIVVPINAIQEIDGSQIVFIAIQKANKLIAKKITVQVGKQYNGLSEILSGLNEGDNVISVGFQDLTDGQTVKL